MDNYKNISIQPLSLPKTVQLVILVITRWHDIGSRMFLRNTIGSNGQGQRHGIFLYKLHVPNSFRNSSVFQMIWKSRCHIFEYFSSNLKKITF